MTEKQYETILAALAEKIAAQESTIALQRWQIEDLEKTLAEAKKTKGAKMPALEIRDAGGQR